jgi:hypothetical protein
MKIASFALALAIGFSLTATQAHAALLPPCNTGARILCGVKPLPKHPISKPAKVRHSGPIARG